MIAALIAGMLSESWIASRIRTGPRSVRSASAGVPAAEVRDHVHEHRGRRGDVVLDAGEVADRLERGSRLPPAVGEHVELGLELAAARRAVVVRRAHVGDHLAGPVVDRPEGGVVDAPADEVPDPALVGHVDRLQVGRGFFGFGAMPAALTHFSAFAWRL